MSEYLNAVQARIARSTISGFPEYEVQADGSVWSNRNWRGYGRRQITPVLGAGGYLKVRLSRPTGYTQRQREEIRDYEPPWVRQHEREGWNR